MTNEQTPPWSPKTISERKEYRTNGESYEHISVQASPAFQMPGENLENFGKRLADVLITAKKLGGEERVEFQTLVNNHLELVGAIRHDNGKIFFMPLGPTSTAKADLVSVLIEEVRIEIDRFNTVTPEQ